MDAELPVYLIGFVYAGAAMIKFKASHSIGWMTNKINRVKLLFIIGLLAVLGLIGVAAFTSNFGTVLGVLIVLKLVSAIRHPVYSQLSNEIIPSNVRATTISLLSILEDLTSLFF